MSQEPLSFIPGIITERTAKDAKGYWKDCNRIRFRSGMPGSMKGWIRDNNTQLSGKCRGSTNWVTLSNDQLIAIGTHKKLYLWRGGTYYDITPLQDSTSSPFNSAALTDPFDVTIGSATVTVNHASHNMTEGSTVIFSNASAVGGITIDGTYVIQSVTSGNAYTITHGSAATSTATGGGTVDYDYEISVGSDFTYPLAGWGASTWGDSTWGTPRNASNIFVDARIWHFDLWGEDLIGNIRNGGIYTWDATLGLNARATLISQAPETARTIIVSPEDRHLIAFGAHDGTTNDPLLIRWSDSEDFTNFTPATTNTAGDKRLDRGTEIVGAIQTRGQILIFTDVSVHSMYASNDDFIFAVNTIAADGCGLMAPDAAVERKGVVYWIGSNKRMYKYDGIVQDLECPILKYIFDDFNEQQRIICHMNSISDENEIIGFYPSSSSSEIDKYFKFNITENAWDYGEMSRTTWIDATGKGGLRNPYAVDGDSYLYQHETGITDNNSALNSFIESHDFMLSNGMQIMHIKRTIVDFLTLTGSLSFTLKTKKFPRGSYRTKGPRTITSSTKQLKLRAKGRQACVRLESTGQADSWQIGEFLIQLFPHGQQ
jgi:hypothetical protein